MQENLANVTTRLVEDSSEDGKGNRGGKGNGALDVRGSARGWSGCRRHGEDEVGEVMAAEKMASASAMSGEGGKWRQ